MNIYNNFNSDTIEFTPFFQDCASVFRVSKNVNGELFEVYEAREYKTRKECQTACNVLFSYWSKN